MPQTILLILLTPFIAMASPQGFDTMRVADLEIGVSGFRLRSDIAGVVNDAVTDEWHSSRPPSSNTDGVHIELKVHENKLYLTGLWIDVRESGDEPGRRRIHLSGESDEEMLADWFSGTLNCFAIDRSTAERFGRRQMKFRKGVLVGAEDAAFVEAIEQEGAARSANPPEVKLGGESPQKIE